MSTTYEITRTLLLSLDKLKVYYPIDDNIEDKYVIPNIIKCEDFQIIPLIGEDKYIELINQITGDTVTNDNFILITKYIQPVIGYYVMSEIVYTTAYKLKNIGVDEPNNSRFNELVKISQKYLNDSNHYLEILKDFMCDENLVTGEDYRFQCSLYLGSNLPVDYKNKPNKSN